MTRKVCMAGLLLIISGPSGSGKSTLIRGLVQSGEFPIQFSVSATSRPPRDGEIDGVDYHFVDRERFERMRQAGEFLESAEVHGNLYGTLRRPVEEALETGRWILLEIDCEGHRQVRRQRPDAVSVFVRAPSLELYETRLRQRGSETESGIRRRVEDAGAQLLEAPQYDYQLVNDTVPQAIRTLRTLLWGIRALRGNAE